VTGEGNVGGLAGRSVYTDIVNSYFSGSVTGTTDVGGLVGQCEYGSVITDSYFSGSVTGADEVGGLVGYIEDNDMTPFNPLDFIKNSHYNIDAVLINGGHYVTIGGIYNAQYSDWISDKTLSIGDYGTLVYNGGYYEIGTVQGMKDLLGFADNTSYKFRLSADIDLASAPGLWIPQLGADFDGNGHTISSLYINQYFSSCVGMFGIVQSDITNLGMENVSVSAADAVGGLAGGLIGSVSNSYVTGSVTGEGEVGGLAGVLINSVISDSFAAVSVTGTTNVGGLAGYIDPSEIVNSYSVGSVSGAENVGGLAGYNEDGTITDSYWNTETSGQTDGVGGGIGGGTGPDHGRDDAGGKLCRLGFCDNVGYFRRRILSLPPCVCRCYARAPAGT